MLWGQCLHYEGTSKRCWSCGGIIMVDEPKRVDKPRSRIRIAAEEDEANRIIQEEEDNDYYLKDVKIGFKGGASFSDGDVPRFNMFIILEFVCPRPHIIQ